MRPTLAALSLALVFMGACQRVRIIPDRDMEVILTQIFLADATVASPILGRRYLNVDTIDYYSHIYQAMGYTQAQFDSTLSHYARNPAKLNALLDRVVARLSVLEATTLAQAQQAGTTPPDGNLWNLRPAWNFPHDGPQETMAFAIPTRGAGAYTITADVLVFQNDSAWTPHLNAYFFHDDGSELGRTSEPQRVYYVNDGVQRTITLTLELTDTAYTHLRGALMAHAPREGDWAKHARVSNIRIEHRPRIEPPAEDAKRPGRFRLFQRRSNESNPLNP